MKNIRDKSLESFELTCIPLSDTDCYVKNSVLCALIRASGVLYINELDGSLNYSFLAQKILIEFS